MKCCLSPSSEASARLLCTSGFGVPGTEIWFGLHLWVDDLHSGPFLGAFTAHFVDGMRMWSEEPRNWLPDRGNSTLPFAQVLLAEGNASHSVHYAYEVLEFFTAPDGSRYGSKFLMLRQGGTEGHGLPAVFELTSLAGGHGRLLFLVRPRCHTGALCCSGLAHALGERRRVLRGGRGGARRGDGEADRLRLHGGRRLGPTADLADRRHRAAGRRAERRDRRPAELAPAAHAAAAALLGRAAATP